MLNYFTRMLDRYAVENKIGIKTHFDSTILSSVVIAEKNGWRFKCAFCSLDFMEDDWAKKLNRLFHGLVQYAKGMWFTPDDEDQFEMNFDLFKYKEEENYETVFSGYPKIEKLSGSIGF